MAKYRKKPVIIDAMQWTGDIQELIDFAGNDDFNKYFDVPNETYDWLGNPQKEDLQIKTLEGSMKVHINDYIIRGTHYEYYSCKKSIFEDIYEKVED